MVNEGRNNHYTPWSLFLNNINAISGKQHENLLKLIVWMKKWKEKGLFFS